VAVENQGQHEGEQEDGINYVAQQGLLVPMFIGKKKKVRQ